MQEAQTLQKKVICAECSHICDESDILIAPHPFDKNEGATVTGCPKCLDVESFARVCDWLGCERPASCGTPTDSGYRSTCGEHVPTNRA